MQKARILIVEDEALVASDIEESLESVGYRIVGAVPNAEEGIKKAREQQPDLVLMDIKLEGEMDGIAAASVIHQTLNIPVIFLTAYADGDTIERAKITEPYGYILKPFKQIELRTAIELALYQHAVDRERAAQTTEQREQKITKLFSPASFQVEAVEKDSEQIKEILEFLKKVEPFKTLADDILLQVAKASHFEDYEAGDLIVFEGDEEVSGFVVAAGRVAMVKSSISGKELIVELLPPGDPFGLLAVVDPAPYAVSVKAQIDSRVLHVPRTIVLAIVEQYREIGQKLVREIFDRLRNAHNISRALAHDKVEVRVAAALTALIPRFASHENGGTGPFIIQMTRRELADLTGSTPETISRISTAMERQGLLDLSRNGAVSILNVQKLHEIARS